MPLALIRDADAPKQDAQYEHDAGAGRCRKAD
jgi:hypothetical protein